MTRFKFSRKRLKGLQNAAVVTLVVGIVALYSSYRRPIWLDEFFQFAWGAYPVKIETFQMIFRSTRDFNLGQTGVYMVLDAILLNIFGANSLALRGPSLILSLFMLTSVVFFFRLKGFSLTWQVIALLAFGAQTYLMYYSGEARPYMPLAAAIVGLSTYYSTPIEVRRSLIPRSIGWSSAIIGSLFHPYTILYAVSLAIVLFIALPLSKNTQPRVRNFVQFINPALLSVVFLTSLALGVIGWGQNKRNFGLNPFQWHSRENLLLTFIEAHFASLPVPSSGLNFLVALVLITFVLFPVILPLQVRNHLASLIAPLSLVLTGILATGILILVSLQSGFWIISRQWLGSMALVTLGLVWYLADCQRLLSSFSPKGGAVLTASVALVFLFSFSERSYQQVLKLSQYSKVSASIKETYIDTCAKPNSPNCSITDETDTDTAVRLAQMNVIEGGPVWSEFQYFYRQYRNENSDLTRP